MGTCLTIGENNVDPNGSEVPQMSKSLALKLKEFTPEEKDKSVVTLAADEIAEGKVSRVEE